MSVVDPELKEILDSAGDTPVIVIISCDNECPAVIKALENAGIRITNTGSIEMGSIAAEITADQLSFLQSVAGISYIEPDREAHIQQ